MTHLETRSKCVAKVELMVPAVLVSLGTSHTSHNYCAMLCVPNGDHVKINNRGLTMVPRGYLRANLLKTDPASEQLIPLDKNTKLIFSSLQKYSTSPGFVSFSSSSFFCVAIPGLMGETSVFGLQLSRLLDKII